MIADEAVYKKIDIWNIDALFKDILPDVSIVFLCTQETWSKERKWKSKKSGKQGYTIRLPYAEVLHAEDAIPIMLKALKDKLGIAPPPNLEKTNQQKLTAVAL